MKEYYDASSQYEQLEGGAWSSVAVQSPEEEEPYSKVDETMVRALYHYRED